MYATLTVNVIMQDNYTLSGAKSTTVGLNHPNAPSPFRLLPPKSDQKV